MIFPEVFKEPLVVFDTPRPSPPVKYPLPTTDSATAGVVVPIPTFPPAVANVDVPVEERLVKFPVAALRSDV